ncbi:MAG: Imm26 family immunity protein [Candidatus Thiodiazotropha endolucinida]
MKARAGDIFEIPINEQKALCKVIWVSEEYIDCFGFVVFSKLNDIKQPKEYKDIKPISLYSGNVKMLYRDVRNLNTSIWPIVENTSVTEEEKELTLHNIAGKLYRGDDFIKKLTSDEINRYPKFLSAGNQAIINMLQNAFGV